MKSPQQCPSDPLRHAHDRRLFLQGVAAIAGGAWGARSRPVQGAVRPAPRSVEAPLRVGIMGVHGRGAALGESLLSIPGVEVAMLCDVDSQALERATKRLAERQSKAPQGVNDFRRILDDPAIDVLVVATPNHWHAPATILGCQAGKHVYVEKPCSHTAEEGEWSVAAARRYQRVVQMGTQRRTWPALRRAVQEIHDGKIGTVHYARTWYNSRRGNIGPGKPAEVPAWLDWDLWQGPAPRRDYRDNLVHYQWHWHWHWGNGELGNNGVHGIDVARWGLDVNYPLRVTAAGGKYRHEDSQETPDTMVVTFDFPGNKSIMWEGLSWSTLGPHDSQFGISFHGTEGSIVIHDPGYTRFDLQSRPLETVTDRGGEVDHLANFLESISTGALPHADIEEAHRSTLLCHLGNIAYRTATALQCDPNNGHILNSAAAAALWGREYDPFWKSQMRSAIES